MILLWVEIVLGKKYPDLAKRSMETFHITMEIFLSILFLHSYLYIEYLKSLCPTGPQFKSDEIYGAIVGLS